MREDRILSRGSWVVCFIQCIVVVVRGAYAVLEGDVKVLEPSLDNIREVFRNERVEWEYFQGGVDRDK